MKTITYDETKFKLVPFEPTDEMLRCLDGSRFEVFDPRSKGIRIGTYKAMLATAPEVQQAQDKG